MLLQFYYELYSFICLPSHPDAIIPCWLYIYYNRTPTFWSNTPFFSAMVTVIGVKSYSPDGSQRALKVKSFVPDEYSDIVAQGAKYWALCPGQANVLSRQIPVSLRGTNPCFSYHLLVQVLLHIGRAAQYIMQAWYEFVEWKGTFFWMITSACLMFGLSSLLCISIW
jgi:hypothetical protein